MKLDHCVTQGRLGSCCKSYSRGSESKQEGAEVGLDVVCFLALPETPKRLLCFCLLVSFIALEADLRFLPVPEGAYRNHLPASVACCKCQLSFLRCGETGVGGAVCVHFHRV